LLDTGGVERAPLDSCDDHDVEAERAGYRNRTRLASLAATPSPLSRWSGWCSGERQAAHTAAQTRPAAPLITDACVAARRMTVSA
jgi:hypothetical protein